MVGQGTKWRRNIAENFNQLGRVHKRYRQTTDRQTNGRQHISSHSLQMLTISTAIRTGRRGGCPCVASFTSDVGLITDSVYLIHAMCVM